MSKQHLQEKCLDLKKCWDLPRSSAAAACHLRNISAANITVWLFGQLHIVTVSAHFRSMEGLVSKQTVLLCRWGSKRQKWFVIKGIYEGQIATTESFLKSNVSFIMFF